MSIRSLFTIAAISGCSLGLVMIDAALQASPVAAEEITVEHGKINTADASPVDPGHFEIEPSFSYTRATRFWDASGDSRDRGLFREQDIGLSLTVGVVENVDVNISGGYSWLKDDDNNFDEDAGIWGPSTGEGFSDMAVSGRYRFYNNEEQHLEIAYIAGVTIPVGTDSDRSDIGTSQEFWSIDQTLVASKDWGRWTVNGDVGFSLPIGDKRENARGSLNADLALGYQVLSWLQPVVELNYGGDYLSDEDDGQALAVTVGLVMPLDDVMEGLRVNVGAQQAVTGENADKATTLSAAVKFAF